ncbi:MAG: chromate transporter, partial [Pseudomonadota bacterium]
PRYLHALNFCMLLPGPEAMQLATYAGWLLHGVRGGLMAGLLFVLPGALVVLTLSVLYALLGDVALVEALFLGVKAAVLVIVVEALIKIARRALTGRASLALAAGAFLAITAFAVPFPVIVLAALLIGALRSRGEAAPSTEPAEAPASLAETLRTALLWLAVWLVPLVLLALVLGPDHILARVALLFSVLAVVSFGGAYAALAWLAQAAVEEEGWLSAGQMLDGLGLAETTPGPLVLVMEFVGFLAGYGAGGIAMGVAAAFVTLWATFAPCFLWVFVGAPHVERLRHAPLFAGAIRGVTAAVVGVIAYLGLWFGLRVLFADVVEWRVGPLALDLPVLAALDWRAALIALLSGLLLLRWKVGVAKVLGIAALMGLALGAL